MRSYSQDLRDKVINSYEKNSYKVSHLSSLFNISKPTLKDWIKRYEKDGDYSSKQGANCGRECKFTDKDLILKYFSGNPDSNAIQMRDEIAPELAMSTVYDTLKRMKITYKKKSQNSLSGLI